MATHAHFLSIKAVAVIASSEIECFKSVKSSTDVIVPVVDTFAADCILQGLEMLEPGAFFITSRSLPVCCMKTTP